MERAVYAARLTTSVRYDFEALPRPPVTSLPCPGKELEGLPAEPPEEIGDAFAHALESGYFESVGWDGVLPNLNDVLGL